MMDIIRIILIILSFLPFIIIAVTANLGEKSRTKKWITYFLLAGLCLFIILEGMAYLMIDIFPDLRTFIGVADLEVNFIRGIGIFLTGIFSILLLFKNLRKIIAEFIPINPDSVVHTTGLVFAFILIGFTMFGESPEELQISELDIITQDLLLIVIALVGIGIFIRRNPEECIKRLKLTIPTPKHIIIGIALIPIFFILATAFEYIIYYFNPESLAEIEKITEMMFSNMTLLFAITASIAAGVSEEILFRGAIQPRFGIPFTAFLFAVVHIQYSALWVLIELFIIGILLGLLKRKTNTTTCIITHAGYNFVVFLSLI